ncbi:MAG: sugar phosphate nucleotidyltransferase [Candidatus Omnitrophota bacterium]
MLSVDQAVIFAGGRGERLRPLTDHLPKPMAPVNGVPFLDYLIKTLEDAGIKKILFLLGYRAETIVNRYGHYLPSGVKVEYSIGTAEDLTGRRLLNAYLYLNDHFLLLYGDNYWPIEKKEITALFESKKASALTTVFSNKRGTAEYGWENNVEVGEDAVVVEYDKKRVSKKLNGVDIGYFIIEKNVLDPKMPGNISFEETILVSLAKERRLMAHVTNRQYYYITNIESLRNFEQVVKKEGFFPISLEANK